MRYQRLKRFKRNQCLTPENQDKTGIAQQQQSGQQGQYKIVTQHY